MVLAFSYDDKQINTETWEPRPVIAHYYLRIANMDFQAGLSAVHDLQKSWLAVIRAPHR